MLRIQPYTLLWRALGDLFADPRLRQLFGRYATYCGSSPFQAPATLMLVAHVEAQGVWSVAGGLSALARALAALAEARGVRFRYPRRCRRGAGRGRAGHRRRAARRRAHRRRCGAVERRQRGPGGGPGRPRRDGGRPRHGARHALALGLHGGHGGADVRPRPDPPQRLLLGRLPGRVRRLCASGRIPADAHRLPLRAGPGRRRRRALPPGRRSSAP